MKEHISKEIIRVVNVSADDEMCADVLDVIVDAFQSRFGAFLYGFTDGDTPVIHRVDRGDRSLHSHARRWTESAKQSGDPSTAFVAEHATAGHEAPVFGDSPRAAPHGNIEVPITYRDMTLGAIQIAGRKVEYSADDRQFLADLVLLIAPVLGLRSQRDRSERVRRLAVDALIAQKARAAVMLQSIGDAVICTDSEGVVDYLNAAAQKLTGWTSSAAIGQPITSVFRTVHEETHDAAANPVISCLKHDKVVEVSKHKMLVNRAGREYSIQDSAAPIHGRGGTIIGAVLVFNDLTEARKMALEISHQANHDALTGLMNRQAFEERLQRVLGTALADDSQHVLCFLDLYQFKVLNDTCGHLAGDELLRRFAECLRDNTHMRDSTSRIGADEFGLLMEHCSLEQAEKVINSLRRAVDEFRFFWEGRSLRIGASFGLVAITARSESVTAVLRAADAACHTAKEKGRNRLHVAQDGDVHLEHRHGEMKWVTRINDALENDRFCLYFQPIESLSGEAQSSAHFELLLRMLGDDDDVILPSEFLPVAERYSLATRIDRWVINRALHWLRDDPARLGKIEQCTINLSGQSLGDDEFLEFVLGRLQSTQGVASKICFELTETAAIRNLGKGIRFITTLKQHGCHFALDDFGSGLSSFGYLKSLPVDYVKIDGQFVRDILVDPIDLAMVKSIHEIAEVMGKRTIAEFVESAGILESLRSIGVDFAQGYTIAQPQALERFRVEQPGHRYRYLSSIEHP